MNDFFELNHKDIDQAVVDLMMRIAGWYIDNGGLTGQLYFCDDHRPVGACVRTFHPHAHWESAMLAVEHACKSGMEINLTLHKDNCSPRHICEKLLATAKLLEG